MPLPTSQLVSWSEDVKRGIRSVNSMVPFSSDEAVTSRPSQRGDCVAQILLLAAFDLDFDIAVQNQSQA